MREIEGRGGDRALCRIEKAMGSDSPTLVLVDDVEGRTTWVELDTGRELRSVAWKIDGIGAGPFERAVWVPDIDADGEDDLVLEIATSARRRFVCVSLRKGTPIWERDAGEEHFLSKAACSIRFDGASWLVFVEQAPSVGEHEETTLGNFLVRGFRARDGAPGFAYRIESGATVSRSSSSSMWSSIAPTDDLDGDGNEDLLLGLGCAEGQRVGGRAILLSSSTGKVARELACGADLVGWSTRKVGTNVCSIPDLDGDGRRDYAVTFATRRTVPIESGPFAGGTSQENRGYVEVIGSKAGDLLRRLEIPDEQDRIEGFGRRVVPVGLDAPSRTPACFIVSHPLASGPTGGNGALELYDGRTGQLLDVRQGARDGAYLGEPLEVITRGDDVLVVVGAKMGPWEILRIVH